jgi:myosin heavy subunit
MGNCVTREENNLTRTGNHQAAPGASASEEEILKMVEEKLFKKFDEQNNIIKSLNAKVDQLSEENKELKSAVAHSTQKPVESNNKEQLAKVYEAINKQEQKLNTMDEQSNIVKSLTKRVEQLASQNQELKALVNESTEKSDKNANGQHFVQVYDAINKQEKKLNSIEDQNHIVKSLTEKVEQLASENKELKTLVSQSLEKPSDTVDQQKLAQVFETITKQEQKLESIEKQLKESLSRSFTEVPSPLTSSRASFKQSDLVTLEASRQVEMFFEEELGSQRNESAKKKGFISPNTKISRSKTNSMDFDMKNERNSAGFALERLSSAVIAQPERLSLGSPRGDKTVFVVFHEESEFVGDTLRIITEQISQAFKDSGTVCEMFDPLQPEVLQQKSSLPIILVLHTSGKSSDDMSKYIEPFVANYGKRVNLLLINPSNNKISTKVFKNKSLVVNYKKFPSSANKSVEENKLPSDEIIFLKAFFNQTTKLF